jgi:hypothetical protein
MEKSASIKNIATALVKFHKSIGKIGKDSTNPFFKKKYCSLPNILDAIKEPLQEAGLCFSQHPSGKDELETLVIHADSGEYLQSSYHIAPVKDDPQALGSAITYARRYALGAILGLTIDEDDDANAASGKANGTNGNHTPLPPVKPLLTDKAFKQGLDRIIKGEAGVYDSIIKTFTVTPEQQKQMNNALKQPA